MALGLLGYCTITRVTPGAPYAAPPHTTPPLACTCVRPTRRFSSGTRARGSYVSALVARAAAPAHSPPLAAGASGGVGSEEGGAGAFAEVPECTAAPPSSSFFHLHLPTSGARCNGVPDRPSPPASCRAVGLEYADEAVFYSSGSVVCLPLAAYVAGTGARGAFTAVRTVDPSPPGASSHNRPCALCERVLRDPLAWASNHGAAAYVNYF